MSVQPLPPDVAQVPHGRTARRLDWPYLPPQVRALIEKRLGSPVLDAVSQDAGYTPGFASVLTGEDGSKVFVKAASRKAQRDVAASYAEEARKLAALPDDLPAPTLLWEHEDDLWIVLGFEYVDGAAPQRPFLPAELDACLDTLELVAERLTPVPEGLDLDTIAVELEAWPALWDAVDEWPHRDECVALAARHAELLAGDSVAHLDARDDNFLLTADRGALLCDWNWPVRGAAWVDTVLLLVSARADGIDADALLGSRPLTRDVDGEAIDSLLAVFLGYLLERSRLPAPHTSPYLRAHQGWYAAACWSWLAARRGWS